MNNEKEKAMGNEYLTKMNIDNIQIYWVDEDEIHQTGWLCRWSGSPGGEVELDGDKDADMIALALSAKAFISGSDDVLVWVFGFDGCVLTLKNEKDYKWHGKKNK